MRRRTFHHLHVVRNEGYIILHFKARMPRSVKDKVSGAYKDKELCNWQCLHVVDNEPISMTVGLTYASGALTATCEKLWGLSDRSATKEQTNRPQDHIKMCQDTIQGFQHRSVRRCKNFDTRTGRKKGGTNMQSIRPP